MLKEYLIRIEYASGKNAAYVSIYGDCPQRPFSIANNLWNYSTPWHAAQRLKKLAKCLESAGYTVKRIYGNVFEMPTKGNERNVELTLLDYGWIE